MVANVLRLFKIPQISYASTSDELSDKSRFEYFSRVVAPDTYQAQVMVDIVKALGWSYVSTVADEGNYGEKGIAVFKDRAKKESICIAKGLIIPRETTEKDFDKIIQGLLEFENAKGVIMFINEDNAKRLMKAKAKNNHTSDIFFIASDAWGSKAVPVQDHPEAAEGAITILPKRQELKDFDNYFLSRNLTNNKRNPWWREFWMQHFHCSLDNITIEHGNVPCTGEEDLKGESADGSVYRQEGLVQFVVDSVLTMAYSVENLQQQKCTDKEDSEALLQCYQEVTSNGKDVLENIRNVSFTGSTGEDVKFDDNGDGLGRYNVFQYQKHSDGSYHYIHIGDWVDKLSINLTQTKWPKAEVTNRSLIEPRPEVGIPISVCSEPCGPGFAKSVKGDSCCWICIKCLDYEYLKDANTCHACPTGTLPNSNKTTCLSMPVQYMQWGTAWAIIPMVFSGAGIISTFAVIVVFWKYNKTPIIKASGRELCYTLLMGVLMCYSMTFVMVSKPTVMTCCIKRIGIGLSLSICYASIFTKTNRISRIFNRGLRGMTKRPSCTSPQSQLGICSSLVSVQIIGVVAWILFHWPQTILIYPDRINVILRCGASDMAQVLSLTYNTVLIALCTAYAFKTRKIPENFNEAKWIAFSMYSTCIVWCAFVAIFFGTSSADFRIRITTLSMCTCINATVILGCLFAPKMYIVCFQPQKNIRQNNSTMLGSSSMRARSLFGKAGPPGINPGDITSPSTSTVTDITLISDDQLASSDTE